MTCIESVSVTPSSVNIEVGKWYNDARATVYPEGVCDTSVTWYSDNTNVATVNPTMGYIYGCGRGTANVYAVANDGSGAKDYIKVFVSTTVSVTSIELNRSNITIHTGNSYTLSATVCPENATNKTLNWTSSNPSVASVSNGTVCGLSIGSAVITAVPADGSEVCASCYVTVTGDTLVSSVEIKECCLCLDAGDSEYLHATVCPEHATNRSVIWSSSNTNIATVNPNSGLVTAIAKGIANVYATAQDGSGARGVCAVAVLNSIFVEDITIGGPSSVLNVGETCQLTATVCPENASRKSVRWCSDDPCVATVDEVSGFVTAKAAGTTYIYATAKDGSGVRACCCVIVQEAAITGTPVRVKCSGGLNVMSSATDGNILGTFEDGVTVYLIDETPQNETIYKVYGTMGSGSSTYGWCSGEHLEKEVDFLRCVYDEKQIKVRNSPTASNGDGNIVGRISKGAEVELLDKSVTSQDAHSWYKVRYNRLEAYVVADDAEDDYEIIKKWILLAQDIIKKRIYAATVYAEAAGQNRRSKQAVAHVMNNRIGTHGLWVDIEAVVSASGQFEGYGNSMYQDAMSYYETGIWSNSIEQVAMDECMSVIIPIYNGEEADITGDALYFHSFPNPEDWAYHNDYTLITVDGTEGFWFYK